MKEAKKWLEVSPNFVTSDVYNKDIDVIITPAKDEEVTFVDPDTKMEEIVVMTGKFKSKGQARKNGWSGEIPLGFKVWQIGKNFQFCTLRNWD